MSPPSPTPPPPGPDARDCLSCGKSIPSASPADDALGGLCPACLLAAGFLTQAASGEPIASDAPPPSPAELAAEFPALEILELLGQGGMGAVYKARQRHLDRLVALKLLRPGLDADPTFADRFTREARSLAQLNHPGIVTLHEFGHTPGGRYFILMEFVDGVNLRHLLSGGRISPREALAIVPPLCDALQYAHDRGLVHRDIKPDNILVDRLGRVKIADFGLAKLAASTTTPASPATSDPPSPSASTAHVSSLTEAGGVMGTPRYMAPEQREHPAAVDHRADIYALGVVLYQMLTGELPDEKQLQPPSRRVRLDVRLDEIVLRALEHEPSRRYASASELKTSIETHAGSAPVARRDSTAAPAPAVASSAKRRSTRLAWLALALPIIAIAVALLGDWHDPPATLHDPPPPSEAKPARPSAIRVRVTGSVNRPGAYPLRHDATLIDAIAVAGGWTSSGDPSAVLVTSADSNHAEVHDLGAILLGETINPGLTAGATVSVPVRNR